MELSWLSLFPGLAKLEPSSRDVLSKSARLIEAPVGTIGYSEGIDFLRASFSLEN